MTRDDYSRVVRAATKAIREADPQRLIIADGVSWGNQTCPELADLGIGQSTRGYSPMEISHYKASWVNGERFAEPIWPDPEKKNHKWDRARLEELYKPWAELARRGVGVHCGECGAYSKTPHAVFLAWFRDVLDILKGHNIGFALWNFRGSFGILDSERADVAYEDFHGRKLDRKLLSLLQSF
jgi:endoglucanase